MRCGRRKSGVGTNQNNYLCCVSCPRFAWKTFHLGCILFYFLCSFVHSSVCQWSTCLKKRSLNCSLPMGSISAQQRHQKKKSKSARSCRPSASSQDMHYLIIYFQMICIFSFITGPCWLVCGKFMMYMLQTAWPGATTDVSVCLISQCLYPEKILCQINLVFASSDTVGQHFVTLCSAIHSLRLWNRMIIMIVAQGHEGINHGHDVQHHCRERYMGNIFRLPR